MLSDAPLEVFDEYEKCLETMDLEIVSTGDFNSDWLGQNGKIQTKKLVEITETLQLEQITEPTRITENSQVLMTCFSLIDLEI